jgi:hypothetical protein
VLASNEEAWQETRDAPGMMPTVHPSDQVVWGTAATKDSTTWTALNDHGTCMAISVIAGHKFVVLASLKRERPKGDPFGDLGTIRGFGTPQSEKWSSVEECQKLWDLEGVLLGPGDTF